MYELHTNISAIPVILSINIGHVKHTIIKQDQAKAGVPLFIFYTGMDLMEEPEGL